MCAKLKNQHSWRPTNHFLRAAEIVLRKNDIPQYYYNFRGYSDDSVCLERGSGGWVVYIAERNKRVNEKRYGNLYEACRGLISELADSPELEEKMLKEYSSLCERIARSGTVKNNSRTKRQDISTRRKKSRIFKKKKEYFLNISAITARHDILEGDSKPYQRRLHGSTRE